MPATFDVSELDQFTGTDGYHEYIGGLVLTDGIKYMATKCGAFWLLDIVASYQHKLKNENFQLWKIEVADGKGVVTCRADSNTPNLVRQRIPYTDFPCAAFEFYCIDGVILLKSEY